MLKTEENVKRPVLLWTVEINVLDMILKSNCKKWDSQL
jgi:hypothetical protein